jgi:hypothetical protein
MGVPHPTAETTLARAKHSGLCHGYIFIMHPSGRSGYVEFNVHDSAFVKQKVRIARRVIWDAVEELLNGIQFLRGSK